MEKRDNIYENDYFPYICGSKGGKIRNDNTKHYPNKNEGRVLRQIMASTGLSEEEVRGHKKYRKMLSDAQKTPQKPKAENIRKWYEIWILKKACKETGFTYRHPDTLAMIELLIEEYDKGWWNPWKYHPEYKFTAKGALEFCNK